MYQAKLHQCIWSNFNTLATWFCKIVGWTVVQRSNLYINRTILHFPYPPFLSESIGMHVAHAPAEVFRSFATWNSETRITSNDLFRQNQTAKWCSLYLIPQIGKWIWTMPWCVETSLQDFPQILTTSLGPCLAGAKPGMWSLEAKSIRIGKHLCMLSIYFEKHAKAAHSKWFRIESSVVPAGHCIHSMKESRELQVW